jgi:hypothetical protein
MFGSFPSRKLAGSDILRVVMPANEIGLLIAHEINYFLPDLLIPKDQMVELVELIRRAGSARIQDILAPFPANQYDRLRRCFGWMLKHGVCIIAA